MMLLLGKAWRFDHVIVQLCHCGTACGFAYIYAISPQTVGTSRYFESKSRTFSLESLISSFVLPFSLGINRIKLIWSALNWQQIVMNEPFIERLFSFYTILLEHLKMFVQLIGLRIKLWNPLKYVEIQWNPLKCKDDDSRLARSLAFSFRDVKFYWAGYRSGSRGTCGR